MLNDYKLIYTRDGHTMHPTVSQLVTMSEIVKAVLEIFGGQIITVQPNSNQSSGAVARAEKPGPPARMRVRTPDSARMPATESEAPEQLEMAGCLGKRNRGR